MNKALIFFLLIFNQAWGVNVLLEAPIEEEDKVDWEEIDGNDGISILGGEQEPKPKFDSDYGTGIDVLGAERKSQKYRTRETKQEKLLSPHQTPLESKKFKNYVEYKNDQIVKNFSKVGKTFFGLSLYKDTFDYKSGTGNFENTYRQSAADGTVIREDSDPAYSLSVTGGKFWSQPTDSLRFGWLVGAGIGYNGGYGFFGDGSGEQSSAFFRLWTIPVETLVLGQLNLGYVKLLAGAGPSVLGLLEYRSDLEDKDKRKRRRQYSFGGTALGKVQIQLNKFFTDNAFQFFSSYEVTNLSFDIEAKYVFYSSFGSGDVSITGLSIGAGFTFDYL